MSKKFAFLFPGQGSQYPQMGKDFYDNFVPAKLTFEEANDILCENFANTIFTGTQEELNKTKNAQLAIYITSVAILRTLQEEFPKLHPNICAGLSLGEYSALFASEKISFSYCLLLVKRRANFMQMAAEKTKGSMAAVLGMDTNIAERLLSDICQNSEVWAANYNYPGQIVITGTEEGIKAASEILKQNGARKIIPLKVNGAFHSPLMIEAQNNLSPLINQIPLKETKINLISNVSANIASTQEEIKDLLIKQVTNPVKWEQSIALTKELDIDYYFEIGPGKVLVNMNKKMDLSQNSFSLEKISDFANVEKIINKGW
jgi:[acyl-carrier-protein] S-malonyltransferase